MSENIDFVSMSLNFLLGDAIPFFECFAQNF